MRKTILALVLPALVAGAAAPALAQGSDHYRGGNRAEAAHLTPGRNAAIRNDIYSLDSRIDRAKARRAISTREATGLHRDARDLQLTYNRYANRGLSASEYRSLQHRVATINSRLYSERSDRDGRRG